MQLTIHNIKSIETLDIVSECKRPEGNPLAPCLYCGGDLTWFHSDEREIRITTKQCFGKKVMFENTEYELKYKSSEGVVYTAVVGKFPAERLEIRNYYEW